MTVEKLRELLAGIDGLSGWKIVDRQIEGRELFFIRRDVDLQRSKDVRHTALTVYKDFREGENSYRGSVTAVVQDRRGITVTEHVINQIYQVADIYRTILYAMKGSGKTYGTSP